MNMGKSKKGILIAFIALALIAVATVVYMLFIKPKAPNPEDLLTEYMECIESGEYEKMYEFLDEESMNSISKEDFVTRNQNIYEGIEAKNLSVIISETEKINSTETQVSYDTSMNTVGGEIAFSNKALWILDKEHNTYKLRWGNSLVFPSLQSDYRVRVNTLNAQRGSIYDRNNNMLAGLGYASSVGLVPGKITEETDIAYLAELLGTTSEAIEKLLSASWVTDDVFVPIKTIKKSTARNPDAEAEALQESLLQIPGVMISDTEVRSYPYGKMAAHLTGYVQKATAEDLEEDEEGIYTEDSLIGKVGLEALYDERLRAVNGAEIVIQDENGDTVETLAITQAKDGEDITLTIDMDIQSELYAQYSEDKGTSTAINPKTGEVLALVSTPAYDPNDFVIGMSSEKWNSLNEDEANPLLNRFRASFVPGSSFKPVTAAIGVSTGIIDPNEDFGASGLSWQKDSSWGSYYITTLHTYETANLKNALIYSDNIYFAKAALKIGADTLSESLNAIGFNEAIPFDITMSASTFSSEDNISSEIQLADSGYGQGQIQVSPLHMASIYSAFVNEGSMIAPYLEYRDEISPNYWIENAFTAETAGLITEALIGVVENPNGTAYSARIDGLTLAGKTGTAEIKQSQTDTEGTELGWFCAYTPDMGSSDSVLIVSMVDDVKGRGGSGYLLNKSKTVFESIY